MYLNRRDTKHNRAKHKKTKEDKKPLLPAFKGSLQDLAVDVNSTKKLWEAKLLNFSRNVQSCTYSYSQIIFTPSV